MTWTPTRTAPWGGPISRNRVAGGTVYAQSLAEAVGLSDSTTRIASYLRAKAEPLGLSESPPTCERIATFWA